MEISEESKQFNYETEEMDVDQQFFIISDQQNKDREMIQQQLDQFIQTETIQNCPQRSDQWYQLRLKSFGGSEIADLMGTGKYKTQKQFFKEKKDKINGQSVSQVNIQRSNIMDWGSFFEPIHRDVLSREFNTNIQETSLALGKNILKGCHQSPDGLSVVETNLLLQKAFYDPSVWNDKSIFEKQYLKVLWEQKCPSFRDPIIGYVPENYIGQIKLGLSIFNLCDVACFSDSVIRICNSKQFTTKTFNTGIIKKRAAPQPDSEALYIGFIDITSIALKMGLPSGDVSSKLDDSLFNQIFELQRRGEQYAYQVFSYEQVDDVRNMLKKQQGTYICWKMVTLTKTLVERSQFFGNLLAIFISLGHQALLTDQKLNNVTSLSKYVKTNQFPLTAENKQDIWYIKNENILINELSDNIQDDWHSLFVFIVLLKNVQSDSLKGKDVQCLQEIYTINKECPDQLQKLQLLIKEVYGDEYCDILFQQISNI